MGVVRDVEIKGPGREKKKKNPNPHFSASLFLPDVQSATSEIKHRCLGMEQPRPYLSGWSPARPSGCQRCCIWSWSLGSRAGSASPRRRTGRNPCTGQLWGPCSGLFWQLGSKIGQLSSTGCPGTAEDPQGDAWQDSFPLIMTYSHLLWLKKSYFLLKKWIWMADELSQSTRPCR